MKRLPPKLLALSPGDLDESQAFGDFLSRAESALRSGLRGLLLREFNLTDGACLRLARELRARFERAGGEPGWLGIHDRLHVARAARADGLHLGFRSLPIDEALGLVDDSMVVGLSTHAQDDPSSWKGADYLFHGPVRPTPQKERPLEAIGAAGLERARARTDQPIWALGGLCPEDVVPVVATGVAGIAVLSGILGQPDPGPATERYLAEWIRDE